eukprot:1840729-Rhodomonas_salina.4
MSGRAGHGAESSGSFWAKWVKQLGSKFSFWAKWGTPSRTPGPMSSKPDLDGTEYRNEFVPLCPGISLTRVLLEDHEGINKSRAPTTCVPLISARGGQTPGPVAKSRVTVSVTVALSGSARSDAKEVPVYPGARVPRVGICTWQSPIHVQVCCRGIGIPTILGKSTPARFAFDHSTGSP